jgi:hypothetical protein
MGKKGFGSSMEVPKFTQEGKYNPLWVLGLSTHI